MRTRRGPAARRQPHERPGNHRPPPGRWRIATPEETRPHTPGARTPALARLEAILFLAEEPLSPRKLADLADLADAAEARHLLALLAQAFALEQSAFQVEEIAGGFQLLTRPEFHPWLVRLRHSAGEPRLSGALLETLAIVAYRQPIMRADLEAIRGVHCGELLRQLMERGLVRIAGRHDSLGRPVLYGTTRKFMQIFGLRNLDELPAVEGPAHG